MEPPKELVFSYFSGNATPVQQRVIGDWLARPENQETYFAWLDEWERRFPQYVPDTAEQLVQFQQRLERPSALSDQSLRPVADKGHVRWRPGRWLVAASILLACCTTGWLLRDHLLYKTISTQTHQLRSLELPDGSTVALNSQSTLRIPRLGYGWLSRRVLLTGDAVFDVKHLPNDQTFVVQTADGLAVEVLGTEFSVRSRHSRAEVVLRRGRVNLHYAADQQPAQILAMKPGDRVTLNEESGLQLQAKADTARFAQWRYRSFSFNATPLGDVARQIQHVFGVTVQLTDPALARRTLTGTIRAGSSNELAEALAELLNLRVNQRGQTLVFSSPTEPQLTQ
ncbi:FecR family protein [Spirosoma sp. KUDC1026]|uniref:FecR family protein n=1 Tax=Spirosoma sp. KUDC1026 TaxID=2745947 RepID=UPI00159BD7D7|nr:FecR domain-containing protein [Spirosoma sp. KUDC1026]QKZ14867.1 FecR domain-containing protein [Spirosoma sp. KUDC1026]